jgi:hypothetical protein
MASNDPDAETEAQSSADHLALALEDAGFDVGQEFPALHDAIGRQGFAVVRIGDVQPAVAKRLAAALTSGAAQQSDPAKGDDNNR